MPKAKKKANRKTKKSRKPTFLDELIKEAKKLTFGSSSLIRNGKPIGTLDTLPTRSKMGGKALEIDRLYIDKEFQRRGVGKQTILKIFQDNPKVDAIDVYPGGYSAPFWLRQGVSIVDKEGYMRIKRQDFYRCLKRNSKKK